MENKTTRITAEQLAAVFNISEFTVNKLINKIPYERIKGRILFDTVKLLEFFRTIEGSVLTETINALKEPEYSLQFFQSKLTTEYPNVLRAFRLIDYDNMQKRRRKGYSLVKIPNKKLGFKYYVRYSYNGKTLPTKWNTNTNIDEEADRFAFENKTRLVEMYIKSRDVKIQDFLEKFYESNHERISERTRKDYHAVIENRFVPFLKKKKVRDFQGITAQTIRDWQDSILAEKIKPQTVNNNYKAVKGVFRYLLRKGIIKEDPCEGVHYVPVYESDLEARGCHELEKMRGVFKRKWKDELSYLLCIIIYTTGMRNSEIERITMGDIVRIGSCRFISVKKSKTKNGIRLVPLHETVYQRVKEYASEKGATEQVFGYQNPGTYIRANDELGRRLKVSEDKLRNENITFYSGRHYWKTLMSAGGLGEDAEELFMGHKVSNDMKKRYNHRDKQGKLLFEKKAKQVFAVLDRYLFNKK